MGEKEKAKELIEKFIPYAHFWVHDFGNQKDYNIERLENAKQCALICVDEMLHVSWFTHKNKIEYRYWQNVKTEIENFEQ